MRKAIKKSLVVTLMLGTLLGYAKETYKPTSFVEGKKVKVGFKAVKKGQTLTIKDENGTTIYKQIIKSSGVYSKIFDLTALENGNYTTELEKDFEIIVRKIKVKNGIVTFLKEKQTKIFKPVIRKEDNLVLISKIAFNKKPVKVVLYYNDEVLVSETLNTRDSKDSKDIINRIYKLSKTEKGDYKILVKTDNREYIKEFVI